MVQFNLFILLDNLGRLVQDACDVGMIICVKAAVRRLAET